MTAWAFARLADLDQRHTPTSQQQQQQRRQREGAEEGGAARRRSREASRKLLVGLLARQARSCLHGFTPQVRVWRDRSQLVRPVPTCSTLDVFPHFTQGLSNLVWGLSRLAAGPTEAAGDDSTPTHRSRSRSGSLSEGSDWISTEAEVADLLRQLHGMLTAGSRSDGSASSWRASSGLSGSISRSDGSGLSRIASSDSRALPLLQRFKPQVCQRGGVGGVMTDGGGTEMCENGVTFSFTITRG